MSEGNIHEKIWIDIQKIKEFSPLVHNITNYVAMELTANALLAVGASPVMSHALEEVEEMANLAHALILNIGTLSSIWVESMQIALDVAKKRKIPIVLDPAGAGATKYRTTTANGFIKAGGIGVIRGNPSEIVSLRGYKGQTKGVDSLVNPLEYQKQAMKLALNNHCVVWMSGKTNVVTDGKQVIFIHSGTPMMSKVAGLGSTASAIVGAFLAVNQNPFEAAAHAAAFIGVAGEIAGEKAKGPGFFKAVFIDTLFLIKKNELCKYLKWEAND